jgi:hypothetical protein
MCVWAYFFLFGIILGVVSATPLAPWGGSLGAQGVAVATPSFFSLFFFFFFFEKYFFLLSLKKFN